MAYSTDLGATPWEQREPAFLNLKHDFGWRRAGGPSRIGPSLVWSKVRRHPDVWSCPRTPRACFAKPHSSGKPARVEQKSWLSHNIKELYPIWWRNRLIYRAFQIGTFGTRVTTRPQRRWGDRAHCRHPRRSAWTRSQHGRRTSRSRPRPATESL